ncbi:hypothetical protein ACPYO6_02305 [Georgenia sp. Z1344]|uniref:hypothetical protein n=1 Tax=Georgenia sp. Z1344 TaxID=3416706 RepID=UPI003CF0AE9F
MPRFNPPPGWHVPPDFMPPVGWRPDPRWPPAPHGWQMWIVDPVGRSGTMDPPDGGPGGDPEATRLRSVRASVGDTEDSLLQTQAWSPERDRTRSHGGGPGAPVLTGAATSAAYGLAAAQDHRQPAPLPSTPRFTPSSHGAVGAQYGPSAGSAGSSTSAAGSPPTAASSPPAPAPPPEPVPSSPWYTRAGPAAVAASTCVALVAVAIWAFVLREPAAREEEAPGKFDVEPPSVPGGDPEGGGQAGAEQENETPDPSDVPDETGTDAPEDDDGLAGLIPADTFPPGQDEAAHTGPDGIPTNTEPIAMLDDLALANVDPFGRISVLSWTIDLTQEQITAQLVGPTDWDATEDVLAHDAGNPPPPEGHVYVTQRVRVTAETSSAFTPFASLLVYWVRRTGEVYGATSAVAPDDLFYAEPIADGGEVEGNLVLCLPEHLVEEGNWVIAVNHSSNGYVLEP